MTLFARVAGKIRSILGLPPRGRLRLKPDHECPMQHLGTEYGGWTVANDGLSEDSVVYSFGVGEDISFDEELIRRYGVTVHAFDPTPRSIDWVRRQRLPLRFVFHDYGIADSDGTISFNPPEDPTHVSFTLLERPSMAAKAVSLPVKRLVTIMQELGHEEIDMLKMDIEGAEYQVIEDLVASDIYPRQLLVEFHHFFPNVPAKRTKDALRRLRTAGYRVFAVSESGQECSLLRENVL